MDIVGVDWSDPAFQRMQALFRRHATTPEAAAEAIITGVRKNRYLVYTSTDIRLAHLAQRVLPPLYVAIMWSLGRMLARMPPVAP